MMKTITGNPQADIASDTSAAISISATPNMPPVTSITLAPAQMLGIADRVGSITPGKDADLVLFDGDPFEYTSHVCTVIVGGEVAVDECR